MAKADVVALIDLFGVEPGGLSVDTNTLDQYYKEGVIAQADLLITQADQALTAGLAVYPIPARGIAIFALFFEGNLLSESTQKELESIDEHWRNRTGSPIAFIQEGETNRTYRLYPTPDQAGSLIILFAEDRDNVPAWMNLPLALHTLSMEYGHDSKHRDPQLATLFQKLSQTVYSMVI